MMLLSRTASKQTFKPQMQDAAKYEPCGSPLLPPTNVFVGFFDSNQTCSNNENEGYPDRQYQLRGELGIWGVMGHFYAQRVVWVFHTYTTS
jgi:hypothetical protein